jgi:hypothetical protein
MFQKADASSIGFFTMESSVVSSIGQSACKRLSTMTPRMIVAKIKIAVKALFATLQRRYRATFLLLNDRKAKTIAMTKKAGT